MKQWLKEIGVAWLVFLAVAAGMAWLVCGQEIKRAVNREAEAREWRAIFDEDNSANEYVSWTRTWRPEVADTQITFDQAGINGTMEVLNQVGDTTPIFTVGFGDVHLEMGVDALLQCTLSIWVGGFIVDAVIIDISATREFSANYSIEATGFHIDGTRAVKRWMGSDAAATHSNEIVAADAWEADSGVGQIVITFGPLSHTCANAGAPPLITPASSIGVTIQNHTSNVLRWTLARLTIDGPTFEHDYTAIRHFYGNNMWVNGNGHELSFDHESDTEDLGLVGVGKNWFPPYSLDLTELGLGKHATDEHHSDYDDVLVWLWDLRAVCPEWQKGGACAPPPGFYPAAFLTDGGALPGYDYGINPLDMICPFCSSQLRPNGQLKVDYTGTWPDTSETDWVGAGAFDDCTSAPMTWGSLHAVYNPYAQMLATILGVWDLKTDYDYACEMWEGACAFLYDRTSLRKKDPEHNLLFCSLPVHIFGVGPLTDTDRCSDPSFTVDATLEDTDFDLSGPLGYRASAWESSDFVPAGGGVGTSANVTFTVPVSGGTLYRDLVDIWLPRCLHMIAGPCFADFLVAARWHQANAVPAGGWGCEWADYDHDVFDLSAYRHMQFEATASVLPVSEPRLRVTYHIATVTNNRNTPNGWVATAALGAAQTITFAGEYDHANGIVWFDLGLVGNNQRPWMKHVSKVELIFGAEPGPIDWTFTQTGYLVKQNDNDPDRSEITDPTHIKTTFHEPTSVHALYRAGGVRAAVDGVTKHPLCTVEQHRVYSGHEKLVEHINWQFGNPSGLDLSAAWALGQYCDVIEQSTQGWAWALPADWNDLTVDANADVFTLGYSFDLKELPLHLPDTPTGGCACMFKAYSWTIVKGLLYKPHGIVGVQGGIHGLSAQRSVAELVSVERREAASGDAWVEHARSDSDAHGYWWFGAAEVAPAFPTSGGDIVHHYTGAAPTYWEYRAGVAFVGRLYERQWQNAVHAEIILTDLDSYEDYDGGLRVYYAADGYYIMRRWEPQFADYVETTPVPGTDSAKSINVSRLAGQACRLFFLEGDGDDLVQAKSEDGELSFTVHATGISGYARVEAIELPLDMLALLMLYKDAEQEWYCTLGTFDPATNLYANWRTPVATTLHGPAERGDLQRHHDGQVAFNFIDGDEKVRVARCTRMEYDATGHWVLES